MKFIILTSSISFLFLSFIYVVHLVRQKYIKNEATNAVLNNSFFFYSKDTEAIKFIITIGNFSNSLYHIFLINEWIKKTFCITDKKIKLTTYIESEYRSFDGHKKPKLINAFYFFLPLVDFNKLFKNRNFSELNFVEKDFSSLYFDLNTYLNKKDI